MFTGIIEEMGLVTGLIRSQTSARMTIEAKVVMDKTQSANN